MPCFIVQSFNFTSQIRKNIAFRPIVWFGNRTSTLTSFSNQTFCWSCCVTLFVWFFVLGCEWDSHTRTASNKAKREVDACQCEQYCSIRENYRDRGCLRVDRAAWWCASMWTVPFVQIVVLCDVPRKVVFAWTRIDTEMGRSSARNEWRKIVLLLTQKKVDFTPKVVSKFALRKAFQMSKNRFRSPDDFTEQSIKKLKLWKTCFCFKIRPSQVGSVTRTIKKWPPYWGSRWKYQTKRYLATHLRPAWCLRVRPLAKPGWVCIVEEWWKKEKNNIHHHIY